MGNYIDIQSCKAWLRKNYWSEERTNRHEIWIFEVFNEEGNLLMYDTLSINFHRTKGQGIAEYTIKDIAKIMKISKEKLIYKIRNKENIDISLFETGE